MLEPWQLAAVPLVAFICEYVDSTLGMGYGTTLTPIFLLMGYSPMQVVPVVLLSELISGIYAGVCHHRQGNVNFLPRTTNVGVIAKRIRASGYIECFKTGVPRHLKAVMLLTLCGVIGAVAAVFVAVNIPRLWLKLYIGTVVLTMGVLVLACINKKFNFSWKKMTLLGLLASFNKAMSGGGYGPVVTGGQILSGVEGKSAVGITSLAEGLTCFIAIVTYLLVSKGSIDFTLAPWVMAGAVLSVPLSARSVKLINPKALKLAIAALTIVLGTVTIIMTLRTHIA